LVVAAVLAGHRAIDTAGQLKHYREDLAGAALEKLYSEHGFKREDLWIQTKFTPPGGQDLSNFIPYSLKDSVADQVRSSFENSLRNLRTDYLDSYILHSPLDDTKSTLQAWGVLLQLRKDGKARNIGISNVYGDAGVKLLQQLPELGVVQDRWFSGNQWSRAVWRFCRDRRIMFQSFWTLSGSPELLAHPAVVQLAQEKSCTPAQVVFAFAQRNGVTPLSGTTSEEHMRHNIEINSLDFSDELSTESMDAIAEYVDGHIH